VQIEQNADRTRLLVYESSGVQRKIIGKILSDAGYLPHMATSGEEALAEAADGQYNIFISSLEHPDISGFELFWRIKSDAQTRNMFTIAVTAHDDKKAFVEALDSGADDFLRKPVAEPELKARLRVADRTVQLQTDLLSLAMTDVLTGISNRRAFMERLGAEVPRAERHNTALCIAMVDIDHFKKINDNFGHATGDIVIKAIADTLAGGLRDVDIVGRLGGEEFAVTLPDCCLEDATKTCERLRQTIEGTVMKSEDGETLQVTVSMGLVEYTEINQTADRLLSLADEALYQSKNNGRNSVTIA
jgi:diguanylate cyclase (GGDEF)-like protein